MLVITESDSHKNFMIFEDLPEVPYLEMEDFGVVIVCFLPGVSCAVVDHFVDNLSN